MPVLDGGGSISSEEMQQKASQQYVQFDALRKSEEAELADEQYIAELSQIETQIKDKNQGSKQE